MKICGIPVVFDPYCATVAVARGIWPFKKIAVGLSWYALDAGERLAVLYHEAGHCRALHMEKRLAMLPLLFVAPGFVMRFARAQEIEADRFAAENGCRAESIEFLGRIPQEASHFYPSSAERVRRLKEISCKP